MKKNLSLIALTFLMLISFSFKSIVANEENNPYEISLNFNSGNYGTISVIKSQSSEINDNSIVYALHNNQRYQGLNREKVKEIKIQYDFSKKIEIFKDEEKILDLNLSDTYIPEIKNALSNGSLHKTVVKDLNNISDEEKAKARTNVIEFLKTKNINISEDGFSYEIFTYDVIGGKTILNAYVNLGSLKNINRINLVLGQGTLFEEKTNETLKNEFIKENEELLNINLEDISFGEYEKVKDSLSKFSEMNDEVKEMLVDEKAKLDEIKTKLDPINNSLKGIIEMININYREHNDAISNRNDINKDEARKEVDRIFNAYKDKLNALKTLDETNELSRSYRDIFISFNLDSYKIQQPQPSVSSTPIVSTPKETLPSTGSKDINFMVLGLTLISISLYTLINKKS